MINGLKKLRLPLHIANRLAVPQKWPQEISVRQDSCGPCAQKKYMDVKCKVALITGGATGIGLAVADQLLCAGLAKAVISGIDDEAGQKAMCEMNDKHGADRCEYIPLDVNNHKQFEDGFKETICKHGNVDILFNNAGMLQDKKWELTIDTNVKGVFRGIILARKYMPDQPNKGGCVVNCASILGFDSFPYAPAYNCSKFAVVGMTKSFGDKVHFDENKVRIIALGPGVTSTVLVHDAEKNGQLTEEWSKKTLATLKSLPSQPCEAVGRGVVYMVEYGPPASCWVVEESKLQSVIVPDRKTYQKKMMDL